MRVRHKTNYWSTECKTNYWSTEYKTNYVINCACDNQLTIGYTDTNYVTNKLFDKQLYMTNPQHKTKYATKKITFRIQVTINTQTQNKQPCHNESIYQAYLLMTNHIKINQHERQIMSQYLIILIIYVLYSHHI